MVDAVGTPTLKSVKLFCEKTIENALSDCKYKRMIFHILPTLAASLFIGLGSRFSVELRILLEEITSNPARKV